MQHSNMTYSPLSAGICALLRLAFRVVFGQLVNFRRYNDIDLSLKMFLVITVEYQYFLSLSPFLQYKHLPVNLDRHQYLLAS